MKLWAIGGMTAFMISCMPQAQVGTQNGASSGLSDVKINFKKESAGYKAVEKAVKKDPKNQMGYSLKIALDAKSSKECKTKYPKNIVMSEVVAIGKEAVLKIQKQVKRGCSYNITMGLGNYAKAGLAQVYVSNEAKPAALEAKTASATVNIKLVPTKAGRDAGIATDEQVSSTDDLETNVDLDVEIDLDESVEAKKPDLDEPIEATKPDLSEIK